MSTTTSPPAAAAAAPPQSGLSPFKNQNPFDPYLPSSPDEEQLAQVGTSHNTPRSHESAVADHYSLSAAAAAAAQAEPFIAGSSSAHVESPFANHNGASENEDVAYADEQFQYAGLGGFETDGFGNSLLLEQNFGPLPAPDDGNEFNLFRQNTIPEPASATSTHSQATNPSRRSTGLATNHSQLMSPVLTDVASPESMNSPKQQTKLLGGGAMSRISSGSTAVGSSRANELGVANQTPAATSSSVEVSPNLAVGNQEFATPFVRVESYTRGDSPARQTLIRHASKRSRGSSRLGDPEEASSLEEEEDGGEARLAGPTSQARGGVDPASRGRLEQENVLSLQDLDEQNELNAKKAQVNRWLSVSEAGSDDPDEPNMPAGARRRYLATSGRRRAKSSCDPRDLPAQAYGFNQGLQADLNNQMPGPGFLLNEPSEDGDYEDDDSASYVESAPASIDGRDEALDNFPAFNPDEQRPQEAHPWIDPIYFPSAPGERSQPLTANAAMVRFLKRAQDMETASRVATWGTTTRRMSDGDLQMEKVFGSGGLLSRLSLSKSRDSEKDRDDWRAFKDSIDKAANKFLPKRTASSARRRQSPTSRPASQDTGPAAAQSPESGRKDSTHGRKHSLHSLYERKDSTGSRSSSQNLLSRIPSVSKRPKSPMINTGAAGLAASVAAQVGGLGVSGSVSPNSVTSPTTSAWGAFKNKFRHGSHDAASEPSFAGPTSAAPAPLSSPPSADALPAESNQAIANEEGEEAAEAGSDEAPTEDKGITIDMSPDEGLIIPTFDGFKMNVRDVNPRLPHYLVERLGQEQLRRYKKLVGFKVEHAKAKETGNCESGERCIEDGGQPIYFPAKPGTKASAQTGDGEEDEDEEAVADGAVSEAQFATGLPMPPAKRLPAEFECPWCFTVKKFQKPSDWSKHVHEDLQPFTCTFQHCPDPKSFKRKADWVRHENERHRQLEWWQCTEEGCSHLCYRRDNFVQHLVREHKLPEPKTRNAKPNKPAVRGPAKNKIKATNRSMQEIALEDKVLYMVEYCRQETKKSPLSEPCPFCGGVCNSFKKLTVHLARHMETLALPVLKLVEKKDVSPDTIISPIEAKLPQVGMSPAALEEDSYQQQASSLSASPYDQPMPYTTTESMAGFVPVVANSPGFQQQQHQQRSFQQPEMSWNPAAVGGHHHHNQHQQQHHHHHLAAGMNATTWIQPNNMYDSQQNHPHSAASPSSSYVGAFAAATQGDYITANSTMVPSHHDMYLATLQGGQQGGGLQQAAGFVGHMPMEMKMEHPRMHSPHDPHYAIPLAVDNGGAPVPLAYAAATAAAGGPYTQAPADESTMSSYAQPQQGYHQPSQNQQGGGGQQQQQQQQQQQYYQY